MKPIRIDLQNVAKYYYTETAVTQALRKVNLQFSMGEFVAITGESGSGKSTLLKVISGMEPFDDGEMYLDGQPTFQYDEDDWEEYRRQKIGFVFQDYSLIGHYSAKENIVSVLLIMGIERELAEKKAREYLERVGLSKQINQRASKLSSGQKQRLSIARALAKNTDIIVADEPTGNLDSETGEQIVKLMQDLSKDHLVIMVTHNYEQVENYVTRKIRLHDGEVVLDIPVNNGGKQGENTTLPAADEERGESGTGVNGEKGYQEGEISSDRSISKKAGKKWERRLARFFAGMNLRTQPGKAALFFTFFLLTATISFMFIGQLLMNADDVFTKEYSDTAYARKDSTRLSVKRKDGKPLTDKDISTMEQIKNVVSVDRYDLVNDINYYYIQGKDYEMSYGYLEEEDNISYYSGRTNKVEFTNKKRFMRSSTCLKQSDLADGRLPESMNEVVLYDDEEIGVDSAVMFYFTNTLMWGSDDNFVGRKMKVVGHLKEKTEQVYFSPEFCTMLQSTVTSGKIHFEYAYELIYGRYMAQADLIPLVGDPIPEDRVDLTPLFSPSPENPGPAYAEIRVSENYIIPSHTAQYLYNPVQNPNSGGAVLTLLGQEGGRMQILLYDERYVAKQEGDYLDAATMKSSHSSGPLFAEIPKELYEAFYRRESTQASVYINSYGKMDHVLSALEKKGYDAVSTLRFGSGDYDGDLVEERLKLIGIASAVLFIMMLAEILILRSLMKIRIKDQFVLKFMGMRMKLMCKIGYVEMRRYCIAAMIVVIAAIHGLAFYKPMLREMLYYYEIPGYLLYIAYNMVAAMLMVAAFNHLLRGRMEE
ncbi:MAG: ABC transporter ATP-binding protein [Lachnospiraceae bacterium]|nr:ABC transporter ATP-binding protein [Lachnospiraceae bacterium]